MFSVPEWAPWACLAAFLAGLRGYWINRTAVRVDHPLQVQLVSTLTTLFIAGFFLPFNPPDLPNDWVSAVLLCIVGGVGYALYIVLGPYSQKFIKLSTYNSAINLGAFLPIPFYYFVFGEQDLNQNQWMGVLSTAFPLLLLSFLTPRAENEKPEKDGLPYLAGAIFALAGVHIVNRAAVLAEYLIDKLLFVVGSNLVVGLTLMLMAFQKKSRVPLRRDILSSGLVAGALNISILISLLKAHAATTNGAQIVPIYQCHLFISTVTAESLSHRKSALGIAVLLIWAVGSIVLIVGRNS